MRAARLGQVAVKQRGDAIVVALAISCAAEFSRDLSEQDESSVHVLNDLRGDHLGRVQARGVGERRYCTTGSGWVRKSRTA